MWRSVDDGTMSYPKAQVFEDRQHSHQSHRLMLHDQNGMLSMSQSAVMLKFLHKVKWNNLDATVVFPLDAEGAEKMVTVDALCVLGRDFAHVVDPDPEGRRSLSPMRTEDRPGKTDDFPPPRDRDAWLSAQTCHHCSISQSLEVVDVTTAECWQTCRVVDQYNDSSMSDSGHPPIIASLCLRLGLWNCPSQPAACCGMHAVSGTEAEVHGTDFYRRSDYIARPVKNVAVNYRRYNGQKRTCVDHDKLSVKGSCARPACTRSTVHSHAAVSGCWLFTRKPCHQR